MSNPVEHTFETDIGQVVLWKVNDYQEQLNDKKSKRTIEKEAIRKKLSEKGFDSEIGYSELGAPYFLDKSEIFISISHSKDWMALYIANQPVGIDVEYVRNKLIEGSFYFVNENEENFKESVLDLQLIWGAKEAIFKKLGGKMDDLRKQVTIIEINHPGNFVILKYENSLLRFDFFEIDGFWIVYG